MTMGSTDRTEMNERRTVSRISLLSPVRVEGDHGIETEWSEMTKLKDASALGAAFRLGRFVERGRLVLMRMVLPNKMRASTPENSGNLSADSGSRSRTGFSLGWR